jgi:putative cell wall-binding protein/lysophospholipase L1-like esterase
MSDGHVDGRVEGRGHTRLAVLAVLAVLVVFAGLTGPVPAQAAAEPPAGGSRPSNAASGRPASEAGPAGATDGSAWPDLTPRIVDDGAVISNGVLTLGVNRGGDLNLASEGIGLHYEPTGADALIPGCLCEGWGVGDADRDVVGWATQSNTWPRLQGTVTAFEATDTTARSVVDIDGELTVVHAYTPSETPNLYRISVTVTNTSDRTLSPRYRRAMDWDVPPTEFNEYVTIAGQHSALLASTNDGFATLDVRWEPTDLGATGTFEDFGPTDQGALFDFDLGDLEPGASAELELHYGAASSERLAQRAVDRVDGALWSFGQPATGRGAVDGTPNTFIFAVRELGLHFRPQPAEEYAGPWRSIHPAGRDLEGAEGLGFHASVTSGPSTGMSSSCTVGVLFGCGWFPLGGLPFRAVAAGESRISGFLDVDGDGVAGPEDPTAHGRITWLEGIDAVALGDSFASGMGAGDYDKDVEVCERSANAHTRVLRAPNGTLIRTMDAAGIRDASFAFIPCGGARSFHVRPAADGGVAQHQGVPPQLDQGAVSTRSDLVTLTIGGNDLGFSDVLTHCARSNCADPQVEYRDGMALEDWALVRLGQLTPQLASLYDHVTDLAPEATVVVAGYPYLFPELREEQNCAKLRPFNNDEQDLIRRLQTDLDEQLGILAAEAGVHYVSVLEHFAGHEICGNGGQWLHAIQFALKWPPISGNSFHPNTEGQRQYAEAIRRHLLRAIDGGAEVAATGLPRNPAPGAGVTGRSRPDASVAEDVPVLTESLAFTPRLVTADGGPGCDVYVDSDTLAFTAGDLLPGTAATITAGEGAEAVVVAAFTADEHGAAAGGFTLPPGLSGDVLLTLSGTHVLGGPGEAIRLVPVAEERGDCDPIPPEVTITLPADEAVYEAGEERYAAFACGDTAVVCLGDVVSGDPLDTSPGEHTFRVVAHDADGLTTIATARYSAGPRLEVLPPPGRTLVGTTAHFTVRRVGPWPDGVALPFGYRVDDGPEQQGAVPAGADAVLVGVPAEAEGPLHVTLLDRPAYWLGAQSQTAVTVLPPGALTPDPTDPVDPGGPDDPGPQEPQPRVVEVVRDGGATRIETALAVAQRGWPTGADTVVVARADAYADALAGGPLAAALDAPILLSPPAALPQAVAAEVRRLGARRAVLLGGTAALSAAVEQALAGIVGSDGVERVAGGDRYGTATAAADRLLERTGTPPTMVYLTEGAHEDPARGWPDALAAGATAATEGRPVLLTRARTLPTATRQWLAARPGVHVEIVGGTASVSAEVEATLRGIAAGVGRTAGPDRFATAVAVARRRSTPPVQLWIATGRTFPDALVAAPALARADGTLLLVDGQAGTLPAVVDAYVRETAGGRTAGGVTRVHALGGTASVGPAVLDAVMNALDVAG